MRSKSLALVFERSRGAVVGEAVGNVADRGEPEGWGAELGRKGDGSILFEDFGLGGEVGVGIGAFVSEGASEGDMGTVRDEKRACGVSRDASRVTVRARIVDADAFLDSFIDCHHPLSLWPKKRMNG